MVTYFMSQLSASQTNDVFARHGGMHTTKHSYPVSTSVSVRGRKLCRVIFIFGGFGGRCPLVVLLPTGMADIPPV